jgi:hypothetical protein
MTNSISVGMADANLGDARAKRMHMTVRIKNMTPRFTESQTRLTAPKAA